jgi:hypothetical protein
MPWVEMIPVWPPKGSADAGDSRLMAAIGRAIVQKESRRRIRGGETPLQHSTYHWISPMKPVSIPTRKLLGWLFAPTIAEQGPRFASGLHPPLLKASIHSPHNFAFSLSQVAIPPVPRRASRASAGLRVWLVYCCGVELAGSGGQVK